MSKTKAELIEENKRLRVDIKEMIETVSISTDNLKFYGSENSKLKRELEELKKATFIGLDEEEAKQLIAVLTATGSILKTYSEELLKMTKSLVRKIAGKIPEK